MKLRGIEPEWLEIDGARFRVRPLTAPERMECLSYADLHNVHKMFELACSTAVVDWDGIEDENGPVKFDSALLGRLPESTWSAIARKVLRLNTLEAADEKN